MKVLIADDEKDIRRLVVFTLQRAGYEVIEAADGKQALEIAGQHAFDLILLDVMMPFISGYDVCRQLRRQPDTQSVPVLFLSAKAQAFEIGEGLAAGGSDYLIKPFLPRELAEKVRQLTDTDAGQS